MGNEDLRGEIDLNFDAFQRSFASFFPAEAGRFALMHGGQVVEFFDSVMVADQEGQSRFQDGVYSIQEVVSDPIDLGFFSHVGT